MATRFKSPLASGHHSQFHTDSFQRGLARWNHDRLAPGFPDDAARALDRDVRMQRLELAFLDELRTEVRDEAAAVPTDPQGFIAWFEGLERTGPGQHDPLFDWLEHESSLDDLKWYLTQEAAGEAGFDDLVAMTQVRVPDRAKLELARNYWDEMGRGNAKGMHGPMLHYVVGALGLEPHIETTVWESLALANAMTAMAANRSYAWHSIGALGVIELTAPARSGATARGMRRLGLDAKTRRYFDLHAVLDVKHSEEWNKEAIVPLVSDEREGTRRAIAMAEGALIRLRCGERCFERYRATLWK
ncbi:iron-containing redox enzyme family protein [Sphingomonas sp. BN140010]|uniref:Iron-containing redox enzyme family protein n=1 Tax=Sphingomonas arvum TaxID=2992113 RepID=A0ABT3JI92_9SPHN|nr:iron-containing redox enzyme family protein [Sphingomonas sp. BN140010]MCW3798491.1 iron-containing redox enzyme family protein [Sphingomonas sp. BN140010]